MDQILKCGHLLGGIQEVLTLFFMYISTLEEGFVYWRYLDVYSEYLRNDL